MQWQNNLSAVTAVPSRRRMSLPLHGRLLQGTHPRPIRHPPQRRGLHQLRHPGRHRFPPTQIQPERHQKQQPGPASQIRHSHLQDLAEDQRACKQVQVPDPGGCVYIQ